MKYHSIYLIPTPGNSLEASTATINTLINTIESQFATATRQSPWTLSHRVFQSTPPKPDPNTASTTSSSASPATGAPSPPSLHHLLTLSPLSPDQTYCYIHTTKPASQPLKTEPQSNAPTPQPQPPSTSTPQKDNGTIVAIPNTSRDAHIAMIGGPMSAIWALRQVIAVPAGLSYTAGPFEILIGELRAAKTGPSHSSAAASPGVIISISTVVGSIGEGEDEGALADSGYAWVGGETGEDEEEEVDLDVAREKIGEFWRRIKVEVGRGQVLEAGMRWERGNGVRNDNEREVEAVVRLWCEILKPRV
ncbi:hypothetical protein B0J11DRAFT_528610 [Dendryphion nanum]|uniref:Mediator of RNA polymerase II transcription subunit 20 n=1 Tax=Dendryphion nanum TaxID=256645 RepID=A0A9P9DUJ1_9PLEO|nr:hypothetical protein B0J11DRAFT_528610 [Dendryphion nanum]